MENDQVLPEELFGIRRTLESEPGLRAFVEANVRTARIARERSSVGFFATLVFKEGLPATERAQWDWNFVHPDMPCGGSFICWREGTNSLVLEAVAFVGEWPKSLALESCTESP